MKKARKRQYKKIIPFVITGVASVSLSLAMFVVFAAGRSDSLVYLALTAATSDALQEDIPEGVAPFYKTVSFSKNSPGDADVVGVPVLTLRDRILLTESRGEVKVALYNKSEQQSGPYFSYSIGNGNDQTYVAGEYGAGEFVIVTTQTSDCWELPLAACTAFADKASEWHYKVVADTFTYILASPDKRDVAIRNARKSVDTETASTTQESKEDEHKGIIETVVDTVTELFGGDTADTEGENDQTDVSESESADDEQSGFQITPSDEVDVSDGQVSAESSAPSEGNNE